MTTPHELSEPPEGFADPFAVSPAEDDPAASLFQEINERRARVENAERLAELRGL